MTTSTESILDRRRRVMMPGVHHYYGENPLHLVRGEGVYAWDADGKSYLDFFAGVAVNSLGHCHPEVIEAACLQMHTLQHTTSIYLTDPMVALAEALLEIAPPNLSRVFFCSDGSGAVEGAMMAARNATGRRDFIAVEHSLHGRTSLAMAATGLSMWRTDPFLPNCVHRISAPVDDDLQFYVEELRDVIINAGPDSIAAMIIEPILGNGGIIVPPTGYLRAIREVLQEHGILLIADEVQTGFCRTGCWFGVDHEQFQPDLMCVAKALGNGFPIGAWLCTETVGAANARPIASTFGGNLPAMAAGIRVLDIMRRDHLAERALELGKYFLGRLMPLRNNYPAVVDVRGRGLMLGVELGDATTCDRVLHSLRNFGILAGKTGALRNVLTFQPPLIISKDHVDIAVSALQRALQELPFSDN